MCTRSVVRFPAASAFAGQDNKHKLKTSRPVASDRPVDLDVGDLQMVAEFEQQVVGVAVSASGASVRVLPAQRHRHRQELRGGSPSENKAVAYPNEEINT